MVDDVRGDRFGVVVVEGGSLVVQVSGSGVSSGLHGAL